MDELHAVALEEIALEGKRGCSVNLLWQLLEPRLPANVPVLTPPFKHHLWQLLRSEASRLTFSTLELQEQAREAAKLAGHTKKKKKKKKGEEEDDELPQISTQIPLEAVPENVLESEETGIVLMAPDSARLSVVGVYDDLEANFKLSEHQLAVLEMVGQRRHHGAVQTDMANELGVQHRNFFYVLKMLESRHMIVRHKLMVPMPASSNNSGWSTTSIVHLPRYAPRVVLGAEAVFKEVQTAQGQQLQQQSVQQQGQSSASYVVRDDATVMQQICDFLGRQNGQYVSESQVKAVLGFTGSATAHRQWRRLRTRLLKIGCIAAELGMIGEKAVSVLKLVKPYKLRLPVVVDSDDEQEEAAGGDEGNDAGTPADDKAAADEGDQEAEGEEAAAAGGSKLPVEVGREQLMLEIICEAGPEGILTPELSKRLGVSPRILLRSLPELCKKFGVRIEYDMPNKALTNRLIAPQHMLDKYNQQRHLLGMTPASVAAATAPAVGFLQAPSSTAQQQQLAEAGASPADGTTQLEKEHLPASAAASGSQASAPAGQGGLLQQLATAAGDKGKNKTDGDAVDESQSAAAQKQAPDAGQDSQQPGQQQQQQAGPSTPVAAGGDAVSNSMDIDDPAAALDAVLREVAGSPTAQAPAAAVDEPDVDSAVVGAAHASVQPPPPPAAAGVGTAGGAEAHEGRRPTAKRLAGLSTHPLIADVTGSTAAAVAKGARFKVRAVTAVAAMSGLQPEQSADQTVSSAQLPDGDTAATIADSAAGAATSGALGPGLWGPGGVSRLQQRRLQVLRQRLQDTGFLMKQELRRLIINSEVQPATLQKPHNLYDGTGPDAKTCTRLIGLLTDSGAAKLVKLQYHQEAVLEPKEVEVLLRADIEQTPELLQRIAVYDAELPGNLRREGMRRALLAQGLVGRAAAAAATTGSNGISKDAFADLGLRVASNQVQLLPVATNLRSLPGYGIRNNAAAAPGDGSHGRKRRPRGSGGRRGRRQAASGEGSVAGDTAAVAETQEHTADPAVAPEATPAVEEGAQQLQQQPPVKGQEIAQLHHNGYIPSLMLRAKLLHQYLCGCVNLKVDPHSDIPQPVSMTGRSQASTTLSTSGYAANTRPKAARRLQFLLADGLPEQPQQHQGLQQDMVGEGADCQGLYQLSRPAKGAAEIATAEAAGANAAGSGAAEEDDTSAVAVEAAAADDQQQCEALEQQLGGRLLSVSQLWLNMPLAVALQVGGSSCRVLNLLQLVCETSPPPTLASFDSNHRDIVFGDRAWKRVVTGLAVLTKLKLVTPARKGPATSQQSWTQCHPSRGTHLVIGTLGVLDEPTQAVDAVPARLNFDFTETGKWGDYWNKMQSLYDTPLFTLGQLQRFFPASCVPDVARHRCWVTYRDMPMASFLQVQARLEGLPVEQLDVNTARRVSEELGLGYSQVHQLVTRLRTDINERREKAGLERIYLLNRTAAADSTAEGTNKRKRASRTAGKAERDQRRRKHEKRRLKRLKGQRTANGNSVASSATTGIPSGSESDAELEGNTDTDSDKQAIVTAAGAAAAGLPPRPSKKASKANSKLKSRQTQGSAAAVAAGSGSSPSGGEPDVSSGNGKQQDWPASMVRRQLPKVVIQLTTPEDAADEAVCAGSAAAGRGSDSWDSDDDNKHPLVKINPADADSGVVADDHDVTGTEDVPARIAGKRHRWTPAQDRLLLKWVVKQRVELGTRGQVRWQHAAGLPLRVDLCTRRFNFLKKSNASSRFIASLEAQATEINKEFSSRQSALQQQLSRLQHQDRVSVNPLLLQQPQRSSGTASHQQQKRRTQVPALVPADFDPPLQPLPGGQQQQNRSQSAFAPGGPGTAASWMAAAGPHKISPEGNIILLPDSTALAKYGKLLEQIEDFVTPRQQLDLFHRGRRSAAAAARVTGDGGPVGVRQQQQRRRRLGRDSDVEQGGFDEGGVGESDAGISSGESEGEDDWALLSNHAGAAGTSAAQQRRSSTLGRKRRQGSRQVRPLKTVADRVARSTALLAAAAAAAAAAIAQRRAAGEQIDQVAEERERQLQLQAYLDGSRKRRSKQRKPQQGSALANPRDLIQSWRRHHAGVETRPAMAKTQQANAAAAHDKAEGSSEQSMAAAMTPDNLQAAAASEVSTPVEPIAVVHRATGVAAEGADAAAGEAAAAAGGGAAAAAAVAAWPYGPAPTVPVMCAMHLITSLLYLVAEAGSLPADASLALLLRFSQAEVAAAFRWLRALGWLNSGAARRPFQLSNTWNKRLRGEGVVADLLDRTPAAQLALIQLGLLSPPGSCAGVGSGVSVGAELVTEHKTQDTAADCTQDPPHVAAAGSAGDASIAQQLLAGLRQVELDKAQARRLKEQQKDMSSQQQQSMEFGADQQQLRQQQVQSAADQQQAEEHQGKQHPRPDSGSEPAGSEQQTTHSPPDASAAAEASVATQPAATAGVQQQEGEHAAENDSQPPHTPKALTNCLAVLHSVSDTLSGCDSTRGKSFWVGLRPVTAGTNATAQPQPVPGGLLLEVIISSAVGRLCLQLCPVAAGSGRSRGVVRGEAAGLGQKAPQLLVQLSAGQADRRTNTAAAADSEREQGGAAAAAGDGGAAAAPQLIAGNSSSQSSGGCLSFMGYCGVRHAESLAQGQPGGSVGAGEPTAAAASGKRQRDELEAASTEHKLHFSADAVGKDVAMRQQAEAACLAAAAAGQPDAEVASHKHAETGRLSKRLKTAGAKQTVSSARGGANNCQLQTVRTLLAAVRAAGSRGVSCNELLHMLQRASPASSATGSGNSANQHAWDAYDTAAVPSAANTAEQAQGHPSLDSGADTSAAAAAAEPINSSTAVPGELLDMPLAAAVAAVSGGLRLLQQYGLARQVPGWHDSVWMSAEDSQRLLAWPLPQQHKQQQQPEQPQQDKQQQGQQQEPERYLQQQEQQGGGTRHLPQPLNQARPAADTDDEAGAAAVGAARVSAQPAAAEAAADKHGSSEQHDDGISSREVLIAPWLDHKGRLNHRMWQSLLKRIMSVVLRNPGIPESLLVGQLDVISPAAAKEALSILVQEKHLVCKTGVIPAQPASTRLCGVAAAEQHTVAAGIPTSEGTVAANKISGCAGSYGYGCWGGGAVALRLGAGLTNCTPTPAKPPSLLTRKKPVGSNGTGKQVLEEEQLGKAQVLDMRHYWLSLTSNTSCHLTCTPPGCRHA